MTTDEKSIILSLAGDLSDMQLAGLQENFELYLNENVSLFVPIYRHCDYATSPNHSHPSFSFIYNIQQKGYIIVNGEEQPNPYHGSSSICAFSPGVHHQEVLSDNDFSNYIAVMINSAYFQQELAGYNTKTFKLEAHYFPPSENLLFLLKLLMIEHNKYKKSTIESLNHIITHALIRIVTGAGNDQFMANSKDIVDVAIAYMHRHIETKISVHDIASQAGLSTSHFSKVFKNLTNKTPIEYLTRIRIEKSKRLLKLSNKNLTEIAYDCGFSSLSYFTRSFAEQLNLTPSEYRRLFVQKSE